MRYVYFIGFLLFIVLISGCISGQKAPQPTEPAPTQTSNVIQTSTVTPTVNQTPIGTSTVMKTPTITPIVNQTISAPPSVP